jgi:radical SAM superfamily enzyme YgiQ (UPF0313 family)
MISAEKRNLLLINGFGTPTRIINELLSNASIDSNIYLSYPLGVLTLAAWCRKALPNVNIQIIDATLEFHKYISNPQREPINLSDFIIKILEPIDVTPDFIGISISFSNGHKPCLELCRHSKEKWPHSTIIAGGVHATTFTHRIIADPCIDFVIRGPGDVSFIDLLQSLIEEKTQDHIAGLVTSMENITNMALPLADLDTIPPYPYDLIDMEYLVVNESTSPINEDGTRTGMIFMSRGCPFNCSFCSANKVHGKKVAFISVDKMIGQIEHLINTYHVNTINIIDDLFGADKEYFYEFFRKIDERNLKFRLFIPGGLSIAVFDEEMIDVLIEHGLNAVYFPVESGSPYVQQHVIKKRVNLDKAARLITHSKKRGLFTGINIVLGSPGETKEHIYETYEYIKHLPIDWTAFFIAFPYPDTEMTNILLARGAITESELIEVWDNSTQGFKPRPFDTEEISGLELSDLVYDFNIELNFFSNYNIRTGNYKEVLIKLDKIINRYPFHTVALACRAKCYHEIGRQREAIQDVLTIYDLIKVNNDSLKLFERYKSQITEITDFPDAVWDSRIGQREFVQ